MSEPSSSGMGMLDARSSDSSSDTLNPVILMDSRWKVGMAAILAESGRGVGEACNVDDRAGGEAGSAVSMARLSVACDGDEGVTTSGDETRLWKDGLGVGEGGEAGAFALEDESFEGTKLELAERERPPPDTILDLGGEEEEATRAIGDVARTLPCELLVDSEGDTARLVGGEVVVRAAEVA